MGWAARANTTIRDGQRPARLAPPAPRPGPLQVFRTFQRPVTRPDGTTVLMPNGKPFMVGGFQAEVPAGTELGDTHVFDGRAIRRRIRKPQGKAEVRAAKRARRATRPAQ
jgi:hypothetical protein